MGTASKKNAHENFAKYMKELFKSPDYPDKLPTHVAICREAGIDRNFYNRVKGNGFQGGVPQSKKVTALCEIIASKEASRNGNPVTAQEVLDGLINAGLLPEGSSLESEVKEPKKVVQEVALQTVNKTDAIQDDKKVKFNECARLVVEEMQDTVKVLNAFDDFKKYAKNKSSKDFGSWK